MPRTIQSALGAAVSVLRYPVKSMQGEELNAVWLTPHGLLGDRAWALVSAEDRKVVSAKNSRKWPRTFEFRAAYVERPGRDGALPPVRITLPDGALVTSDQDGVDEILSRSLAAR